MLDQGCPIEFFRVQKSPFCFFSTNTFLQRVQMFLNVLCYFYKKNYKGSLNIANEQKLDIFEKKKHITLTEKSFRYSQNSFTEERKSFSVFGKNLLGMYSLYHFCTRKICQPCATCT
jgi:hypothetical protein